MAGQRGPAARREEPETVVEPGRESLYPKRRGARRRKLDRQRDAVEATTNSGDRGRRARVRRKVRRGGARPLDEQPDGAIAKRVLAIRAAFRGDSERRYPVNPLALRPERLAAGGDHPHCRVGAQQRLGHSRRRVDHMLAIVEHKHELLRAERVRDGLRRCRARSEFEPERGSDGDRDEVGIGQRRQLDGPNPIGEFRQQVSCDLKAEPGLADASGAGQGDEAMGGAEVQDLGQLGVAADQFGNRLRQVRGRAGWRGRRFAAIPAACRAHRPAPRPCGSLR